MSHAAQIIQCPVLSPHGKNITSKLTTGQRKQGDAKPREALLKTGRTLSLEKYTARKRDEPSLCP